MSTPPPKKQKQSGPPPKLPGPPKQRTGPVQENLFDVPEDWQKEWQGMPEFVQEDQKSFRHIIVHFRNHEDAADFGERLEQKVTTETKSMWHPKVDLKRVATIRYKSDK